MTLGITEPPADNVNNSFRMDGPSSVDTTFWQSVVFMKLNPI